jgi:hypothetical protein
LDSPSASPFGSRPVIQEAPPPPKEPTPQTPEQRTSTVVGTQRTQQEISFDRAKVGANLGESFRSDPAVKAYREVIPQVAAAEGAAPGGPGDISVLYAWAKAMDPTGSVREGDVQLGQSATGPMQRAQFLMSQYRLQDGGQLPPEVRVGLIEEMRNKARQLNQQYSAVHDHYLKLAHANGVDPATIGEHEGTLYRGAEEQYIRAHGGTPRDPAAPLAPDTQPLDPNALPPSPPKYGDAGTEIQFKDDAPNANRAQRFQDSLFQGLSARQLRTRADVESFVHQFNQQNGSDFRIDWSNPDTRKAIGAAMQGKKFGVERPNDPEVQRLIDEKLNAPGNSGSTAAFAVHTADPLGIGPRAGAGMSALAGSLQGQGSFNDLYNVNLDANRGYLDAVSNNHPIASTARTLAGGFLLPAGEASTPAQFAKLGAAYGGFAGAMQGDSQTSLTQRGVNTLLGAGVGGTLGYAIPKGLSMIPRKGPTEVPPLVDPQTGELNQVMDAMTPAERVQQMRDYGMQTITPAMAGGRSARVIEQGLNNVPGSAGVMEDINSAASGELRRAMQGVAQKFGTSKTLNEGGSAIQTGALARNERAEGVIAKAYSAIPIPDTAPASKLNTIATLQQLTGRFQSNPKLAEAMKDPRLAAYLDAFQSGDISWKDLKEFRSIIGEKIGDMRFGESSSTSDLRALYAGLSEDMRTTAAQLGPKAIRSFERANTLNRQNEELIQGALTRILGPDGKMTPEKAASAVQTMTMGGKAGGDLKTLAQIRAATIKSGAWDEIASTLIHLGGQPAKSEGRQFDPKVFVQWYADMAEPARRMLFKPELRKALDGFVAVNQQLSRMKGLTNSSNTTPTMIGSGVVGASGIMAATHPLALAVPIAGAAANYGMAKLWTSPQFVRLLAGYSKALASGNESAVRSQVGRLSKLAATNPELREPLEALLKRVANDNVVPEVAASTNADSGNNDQQRQ